MFHRPMSLLLNDHVQTKCPNKQTKMSKQTNKQTNKQKMSKQNHLSASYASFVTAKFRKLSRRGISVEIFI